MSKVDDKYAVVRSSPPDPVDQSVRDARQSAGSDKFVAYDTNNPTDCTYFGLREAFEFFNRHLFDGKLPSCLITLQRKSGTFGYHSHHQFSDRDGGRPTDEIALNPATFLQRTTTEVLSTFVYGMVRMEQSHFGKPSRAGYHNKEFSQMMLRIGLIPSTTGAPGGAMTGQSMSYYIETGGKFERACAEILKLHGNLLVYVDSDDPTKRSTRERKAASKTKYECPSCGNKVWAKPNTGIICADCRERFVKCARSE